MKLEFSRHMFDKCWNIKFHENPSCGIRVVTCGQTEGQTDMKLIVHFPNHANAPKKSVSSSLHVLYSSPVITSVIKSRMTMWVGSCGTHVCVKNIKKHHHVAFRRYRYTAYWRVSKMGKYIRDKKQDLFMFPELWFRQRETWPRSVVFYRLVSFKFWIPLFKIKRR
jgi:hypothetical protein